MHCKIIIYVVVHIRLNHQKQPPRNIFIGYFKVKKSEISCSFDKIKKYLSRKNVEQIHLNILA